MSIHFGRAESGTLFLYSFFLILFCVFFYFSLLGTKAERTWGDTHALVIFLKFTLTLLTPTLPLTLTLTHTHTPLDPP